MVWFVIYCRLKQIQSWFETYNTQVGIKRGEIQLSAKFRGGRPLLRSGSRVVALTSVLPIPLSVVFGTPPLGVKTQYFSSTAVVPHIHLHYVPYSKVRLPHSGNNRIWWLTVSWVSFTPWRTGLYQILDTKEPSLINRVDSLVGEWAQRCSPRQIAAWHSPLIQIVEVEAVCILVTYITS